MTEQPERFWSVTTILGAGKPKGRAIENWLVSQTAEYALDHLGSLTVKLQEPDGRAACLKELSGARWAKQAKLFKRGADVHRAAERLNLGVGAEVTEEALPYVRQYQQWLADFELGPDNFVASEAPVYSARYRYAGTLDAIIELGGRRYLLDIKTFDKPKDHDGRKPPYDDHPLQLAAYRHADFLTLLPPDRVEPGGGRRYYLLPEDTPREPMPETEDVAYVLAVSPYEYRFVPVRVDETVWRVFLAAREVARYELENVQASVIDEPLTPPLKVAA